MRYQTLEEIEALPVAGEAERAPTVIGRTDLPRVSVDFVAACSTVQLRDVAQPTLSILPLPPTYQCLSVGSRVDEQRLILYVELYFRKDTDLFFGV